MATGKGSRFPALPLSHKDQVPKPASRKRGPMREKSESSANGFPLVPRHSR